MIIQLDQIISNMGLITAITVGLSEIYPYDHKSIVGVFLCIRRFVRAKHQNTVYDTIET